LTSAARRTRWCAAACAAAATAVAAAAPDAAAAAAHGVRVGARAVGQRGVRAGGGEQVEEGVVCDPLPHRVRRCADERAALARRATCWRSRSWLASAPPS
jgi:hypothetical protein